MTVSPAKFIDTLFFGYQNAAVLRAALELDVFTAIGSGTVDVAALAGRCAAAPRGIAAMCDSLVVMGFLTKSSDRYGLSPDAAVFLDRASPACIADVHMFLASPEMIALALQDPVGAVRRGGAPGLGTISPDNPVWVRFAQSMGPFMAHVASLVVQRVGLPAPRRVLDIAAGHGQFGIAFGRQFADCHVTGLDWAPVAAVAQDNAAAAGLEARYATITGSAFEADWRSGYDLVLLPNFLHHFDTEGCTTILRRAHAALAPGGRVAIIEWVTNDDRVSPPAAALFTMTMLFTTPAGSTYTASELSAMLAEAGFAAPAVIPLEPTPMRLLLAEAG